MKKILHLIFVLIFAFKLAGFAQEQVLGEGPPLKQNKVSLDIKGMDVVDVLKMLAGRADINIVIGKNVSGRVTLILKEVDVWDAFEIILAANDLAYEKQGDIINVTTQRDFELLYGQRYKDKKDVKIVPLKYAKGIEISKALNQIKTNIGRVVVDEGSNTIVLMDTPAKIQEMLTFIQSADLPIQTQVFSLDYAVAEKVSPKIQEILTKGVGSMRVDERTNKIIITDLPNKLTEISKIIAAFDEKTPQVLIDAQIIQLTPSDKLEMGINWDYILSKYFEMKMPLPINTTGALILGTTAFTPAHQGSYTAVLDILRTLGDTKVLASPRIMALNNQEAKIHVGTKDAYITSTQSQGSSGQTVTAQSVNFVDTGIQLSVTPTINRDGYVTMKIKPEISDATRTSITSQGEVTQIPIVSTSEAETTVMVKDGVTIIIGGLRKDKREKSVKKIPFVGDIPGLGFFFRSTSDSSTKQELVILLTPHIMSGDQSYTEFSEIPPKEGAVANMKAGRITKERFSRLKVDASSEVKDEARDSKPDYFRELMAKINLAAKKNAPRGKQGEILVSFKVNHRGTLIDEPIVLSATNGALVASAVKAIKDAFPYEPFPKELDKADAVFKINLLYE